MWLVTGVVSWVDSFLLFLVKLGGSACALPSRAPPTTRPQVAPLALPVLRPRPRSPLFFPSVSVFNSRFSVCVFVPPSSSPLWASRSNFARGLVGSLRASWLRPACPRRPLSEARPSPLLCGHLSRPSPRHVAVIRCWPCSCGCSPRHAGATSGWWWLWARRCWVSLSGRHLWSSLSPGDATHCHPSVWPRMLWLQRVWPSAKPQPERA